MVHAYFPCLNGRAQAAGMQGLETAADALSMSFVEK
jgi:hypothetical protein